MPQAIPFLPEAPSIVWVAGALTEITNAFISASLKPFRVARGQLALHMSTYHGISITMEVQAKI